MNPEIADWLSLALRWAHAIFGITWIGESFFFMWLDASLEARKDQRKGAVGQSWLVHGGGFYVMEKFAVAPDHMPERLHWFKWEAGFTWLSGFVLLVVVFHMEAAAMMVDPRIVDLPPWMAVGFGLTGLVAAWAVYDLIYASSLGRNEIVAGALAFTALAGLAFFLAEVMSGRAAFVHVGAMLGTVMAANVWMRIIPNQRRAVAALLAGQAPDSELGRKAKQRSVHNSYLTLPVVFAMISGHYPGVYGHAWGWAALIGLGIAGALARHYFIRRNQRRDAAWSLVAALAIFLGVAYAVSTTREGAVDQGPPVAFAEAEMVIKTRCTACHATEPTDPDIAAPPGGVVFERLEDIQRHARAIRLRAVSTWTMPPANKTDMTREERELLGRWIAQGAKGP